LKIRSLLNLGREALPRWLGRGSPPLDPTGRNEPKTSVAIGCSSPDFSALSPNLYLGTLGPELAF
jgi:hypothetical protein